MQEQKELLDAIMRCRSAFPHMTEQKIFEYFSTNSDSEAHSQPDADHPTLETSDAPEHDKPTLTHPHAGDTQDIAAWVVNYRKKIGLTQKQLAARLGLSVRTLQDWEHGRRTPRGPARALLHLHLKNV